MNLPVLSIILRSVVPTVACAGLSTLWDIAGVDSSLNSSVLAAAQPLTLRVIMVAILTAITEALNLLLIGFPPYLVMEIELLIDRVKVRDFLNCK